MPVRRSKIKAKTKPARVQLPDALSPSWTSSGCFGKLTKQGIAQLGEADRMELDLLAQLSRQSGQYVFKHKNGRYGHISPKGKFVPFL